MNVLILKPSSLGDVVQALPVLRMLKLHWPGAEIYWWIEVRSAALLEGDPDLAGLIPFDRQRWGTPIYYGDIWRCIRDVRRRRFDLVIDLQALARSGTVAWLANARKIVGLGDWRELSLGYYDVSVPRPSSQTHAVDWYLEVLKVLHVPVRWDFEWLPARPQVAQWVLGAWSIDGARSIVLLPGARWENKRWPVEHFAEVVRQVRTAKPDLRFIILGGGSDRELGARIAATAPEACTDLTGRTNLPEAVEVIRASRLVLTNDTGPMHIAAALRKPVVGLFGPTNPARTGPYGQTERAMQRRDLPCVPCLSSTCRYVEPMACLRGLLPSQITAEVLARL